jgi:hypothetical protein
MRVNIDYPDFSPGLGVSQKVTECGLMASADDNRHASVVEKPGQNFAKDRLALRKIPGQANIAAIQRGIGGKANIFDSIPRAETTKPTTNFIGAIGSASSPSIPTYALVLRKTNNNRTLGPQSRDIPSPGFNNVAKPSVIRAPRYPRLWFRRIKLRKPLYLS